MVAQSNIRPGLQHFRGAAIKQLEAEQGVRSHNGLLLLGQAPRLEQNCVCNAHFANVMHGCGLEYQSLIKHRQAQLFCNQGRVMGHAQNVRARVGVTVFGGSGQAHHGFTLTIQYLQRGPAHLLGQPGAAVGQLLLRITEQQHIFNARLKLDFIHRLDQKISRTSPQGFIADLFLIVGGHHQDRCTGSARQLSERINKVDAVQLRHHVIHNNQVWLMFAGPSQGIQRA